VRFRTVSQKGRKCSAYDLFSCFPERFSAILESPDGSGAQHLVSRDGHRSVLQSSQGQSSEDFFIAWEQEIKQRDIGTSPCIAHLFYAAYEAAGLIENLPEPVSSPPACILWALYPDWSLCFEDGLIHLAAESEEVLDQLQHMLETCDPAIEKESNVAQSIAPTAIQATNGAQYKKQVEQVKDLIAAGDIFQANIARFWSLPFAVEGLANLYRQLRRVNPAPFSCFVRVECDSDELHILSASPERLFRISVDGMVDTRPIAGTRRRGVGGALDAELREEMLLSDKERAEHIMLVDLERNDLGRVCVPGTVEVNERMAVEGYATVQHIVSNVRGRLRDGLGLVDVFRAMFPGGTITGCPKVHCMEIIHDLEGRARGPYTGGVGFTAWNGSADMNILIRTFWHHDQQLHWAAGAGIVADSDPDAELIETGHKAEGLMRALDIQS